MRPEGRIFSGSRRKLAKAGMEYFRESWPSGTDVTRLVAESSADSGCGSWQAMQPIVWNSRRPRLTPADTGADSEILPVEAKKWTNDSTCRARSLSDPERSR